MKEKDTSSWLRLRGMKAMIKKKEKNIPISDLKKYYIILRNIFSTIVEIKHEDSNKWVSSKSISLMFQYLDCTSSYFQDNILQGLTHSHMLGRRRWFFGNYN